MGEQSGHGIWLIIGSIAKAMYIVRLSGYIDGLRMVCGLFGSILMDQLRKNKECWQTACNLVKNFDGI